ncbi:MAG: hypothetical protein RSB87_05055, partial [Clostridia bacterium]
TTENLSGIVKYMYRYSNGVLPSTWTEIASTATTIDIPLTNLTELTPYTIEVKTIDNAGNESAVNQINFTTIKEIKYKPVISTGLTPIKWNVSNVLETTTDTDPEWFDYPNKKWANAQTADGSMWTWIPRYAYRIIYYDKPVIKNVAPADGNIVGYSDNRGLVNASGTASTSFNRLNGRVEVVFLGADNFKYLDGGKYVGDVTKTGAENPKNYVVHPAFSAVRRIGYTKRADGNFGWNEEIPGFWVSKFEMGPECVSKQHIPSQRNITDYTRFAEGRNIASKRGITGGDSMPMTNTQWGAVAYLAKALGRQPDLNDNSSYITGDGDYIGNILQSTTGNATGIYDMAGGAYDALSGYIIDRHYENRNTKYFDVYAGRSTDRNSNFQANYDKYGDAVYEVANYAVSELGWDGTATYFPCLTYFFFIRGGTYKYDNTNNRLIFQMESTHVESTSTEVGWRRNFCFETPIAVYAH